MTKSELQEIRELLEGLASASTANEGEPYLLKLDSMVGQQADKLKGYTLEKLLEAVSYADKASQEAHDKEQLVSNMQSAWYVFEQDMKEEFRLVENLEDGQE